MALTGGDDYEILAAVPPRSARDFIAEAKAGARVPVTQIGKIARGRGGPVVIGLTWQADDPRHRVL